MTKIQLSVIKQKVFALKLKTIFDKRLMQQLLFHTRIKDLNK